MSPSGPYRAGLAAAASLLLILGAAPGSVVAADDPVTAVEDVFEAIDNADYDALEGLVCAAERASVREAFDPLTALGLTADGLGGDISFRVEDRAVELVSEEAETATVHITGTMRFEFQGDDMEGFLRAMLEQEMGADASDEDIEAMLPFMRSLFERSMPIDQDVEVVLEDGTWLMCGELGEDADEPEIEPSVSTDGICGLVSPDELNGLSELAYDSSFGMETFCSYSTSDYDAYHSVTVTYQTGQSAEELASYFGADQALEVGGAPAFASDPEASGVDLFTQVGDAVLHVSLVLPERPPEGFDGLAHAVAVSERFLSRADEIATAVGQPAGPVSAPTPPPTPSVSLCEMITLEIVNEAAGLGLDEASGDPWSCGYYAQDGDPGFHSLTLALTEMSLADYASFFTGMTETSVGEAAALEGPGQLLVELPDSPWLLMVSGFVDPSDESVELTDAELLRLVAELAVPLVIPPDA